MGIINLSGNLSGTVGTGESALVTTPFNLPVTASSPYSPGFVVGGLFQFSDFVTTITPPFDSSGTLSTITVSSSSVQTTGLKLYIFALGPTSSTLNDFAAPSVLPADLTFVIGVVDLVADSGLATGTVWNATDLGIDLYNFWTTNLFGVLICDGTPTFTSTNDVNISMIVTQG